MLNNANGLFNTRFEYPEYGKETNIQDPFGWGHFGDGETPNFGDGDGVATLKMFQDTLGRGKPQTSGFLGENPRKTPNFGDGDGVTTLKMFGDTLGTGEPQILGFFGVKSPKKPDFRG